MRLASFGRVHEPSSLPVGLHETLLTEQLQSLIDVDEAHEHEQGRVDEADQAHVLSRHIASALQRRLAAIKDPTARLATANDLLRAIEGSNPTFTAPVEQLLAVRRPAGPGQVTRDVAASQDSPQRRRSADQRTRRAQPCVRAARRRSTPPTRSTCCAHSSCGTDCGSSRANSRPAREAGIPIRVVTTTYIGGTQREALDRLGRRLRR